MSTQATSKQDLFVHIEFLEELLIKSRSLRRFHDQTKGLAELLRYIKGENRISENMIVKINDFVKVLKKKINQSDASDEIEDNCDILPNKRNEVEHSIENELLIENGSNESQFPTQLQAKSNENKLSVESEKNEGQLQTNTEKLVEPINADDEEADTNNNNNNEEDVDDASKASSKKRKISSSSDDEFPRKSKKKRSRIVKPPLSSSESEDDSSNVYCYEECCSNNKALKTKNPHNLAVKSRKGDPVKLKKIADAFVDKVGIKGKLAREKFNKHQTRTTEFRNLIEDISKNYDSEDVIASNGIRKLERVNYNEEEIEKSEESDDFISVPELPASPPKPSKPSQDSDESDYYDPSNSPIRTFSTDDFLKMQLKIERLELKSNKCKIIDGKICDGWSDDAMDESSSEIQIKPKETEKEMPTVNTENVVSTLSFIRCTNGDLKYRSSLSSYLMIYADQNAFLKHIQAPQYKNAKWDGLCQMCNKQVSDEDTLMKEFEHMKEVHIDESEVLVSSEKFPMARKRTQLTSQELENNIKETQQNEVILEVIPIKEEVEMTSTIITEVESSNKPENENAEIQTNQNITMQGNQTNLNVKEEPEENIMDDYSRTSNSEQTPEIRSPAKSRLLFKVVIPKNQNIPTSTAPRLMIKPRRLSGDKLSNQESQPNNVRVVMKTPQAQPLPYATITKKIVQLPSTSASTPAPQVASPSALSGNIVAKNPTKMLVIQRTNSLNVCEGVDQVQKLVNAKRQSLDLAKSIMQKCKNKTVKPVALEMDYSTPQGELEKTKRLRPWLDVEDLKTSEAMLVQCDREFLREIFKCMHPRCSMHTNEPEKFAGHLHLHEGPHKCCYCLFEGDASSLPVHIVQQHGTCKFACRYCFYRTVNNFCIESHMLQFHNGEKNNLKLQYQIAKFWPTTPEQAKEKRKQYVKPIRCPVSTCKETIYEASKFEEHRLLNHSTITWKTKCIKCNEVTTFETLQNHLKSCYNIARFHCLHCNFATDKLGTMGIHVTNKHPEESPIYCDRKSFRMNYHPANSIESTEITGFYKSIGSV